MVHTYRVDTERLHERGIELALRVVDKRVIGDELVGDSSHEELVAIAGEELGTFDRDGGNGVDGREPGEGSAQDCGAHGGYR